jgi:hypothetical protein
MTKTFPKLVPTESKPTQSFDEAKQEKLIKLLRKRLMNAAVKFVVDGASDNWGNKIPYRLRLASDFSGIPVLLIAAEIKNRK